MLHTFLPCGVVSLDFLPHLKVENDNNIEKKKKKETDKNNSKLTIKDKKQHHNIQVLSQKVSHVTTYLWISLNLSEKIPTNYFSVTIIYFVQQFEIYKSFSQPCKKYIKH